MNDPYKVLGVSPSATDDEIKKAYRELAKKYHPDNYAGSDLADLASEKMKEINEAYEAIKKMRAEGTSYSSTNGGYSYGYGGFNTSSQSSYGSSLGEARRLIAAGSYANAENILDGMRTEERNAEWHYLKGCILMQRGAFFDAQRHIDTACRMEPSNAEYANASAQMRSRSDIFGGGQSRQSNPVGNMDTCDCCTSLLCADCLCECLGGDLIPCC